MITWVDDTAKRCHTELQMCHTFHEYSVIAKFCWAKNCHEEKNTSTQIIFVLRTSATACSFSPASGSRHSKYETSELENKFIFDIFGTGYLLKIKESVVYYL